jgi:hypothetical protein
MCKQSLCGILILFVNFKNNFQEMVRHIDPRHAHVYDVELFGAGLSNMGFPGQTDAVCHDAFQAIWVYSSYKTAGPLAAE